jgi:hypothetical protein
VRDRLLPHRATAALAPGGDLHRGPAATRRRFLPARRLRAVITAAPGAVAIRAGAGAGKPALSRRAATGGVPDSARIAGP